MPPRSIDMAVFHSGRIDDEVAVRFLQQLFAPGRPPRVLDADPVVEARDQLFVADRGFRNVDANAADDDAIHTAMSHWRDCRDPASRSETLAT